MPKIEKREDGFTLIEILVVILVVGILAAIAIPVFLNQRKKAYDASVEAAVHHAAIGVETFFTNNPKAEKVDIEEIKKYVKKDLLVRLTFTGNAEAFCIEGDHQNGGKYVANAAWDSLFVYSSTDGAPFVGSAGSKKCGLVGGGKNVTHAVWYAGQL